MLESGHDDSLGGVHVANRLMIQDMTDTEIHVLWKVMRVISASSPLLCICSFHRRDLQIEMNP